MIDIWAGTFHTLHHKFRPDCPACRGQYDYLNESYFEKVTPLCGQTRAVQIVNTKAGEVTFNELAARLRGSGDVRYNEYILHFSIDDYEIIVFPDGRAIIKNTVDEVLAKELYNKYIGKLEP